MKVSWQDSKLESFDGESLHVYKYAGKDSSLDETIVFIHAYSSESSCYFDTLAELLSDRRQIVTMDLRGHGQSSGQRGYASHLTHYLDDLDLLLARLQSDHPGTSLHLIGHQFGASLLLHYALSARPPISSIQLWDPFTLSEKDTPRWWHKLACLVQAKKLVSFADTRLPKRMKAEMLEWIFEDSKNIDQLTLACLIVSSEKAQNIKLQRELFDNLICFEKTFIDLEKENRREMTSKMATFIEVVEKACENSLTGHDAV